jgi:hypothetical protein
MKIYFLFIFLLLYYGIYAQTSLTAGAEITFGTKYSPEYGLGGSLHIDTKVSQHVGIRAYTGLIYYFSNFYGDNTFLIPIRLGISRTIYKMLFIYGEAGLGFYEGRFIDHTDLSYALGAGYQIPFDEKTQFIELSAYFNSTRISSSSSYKWINIRVAYGFDLKKK